MSRSVRHQPFAAYCGGNSQKVAKQCCNRVMRRGNRAALLTRGEEALYLRHAEALNRYDMPQDGSRHYHPFDPARTPWRLWFKWVKAK